MAKAWVLCLDMPSVYYIRGFGEFGELCALTLTVLHCISRVGNKKFHPKNVLRSTKINTQTFFCLH